MALLVTQACRVSELPLGGWTQMKSWTHRVWLIFLHDGDVVQWRWAFHTCMHQILRQWLQSPHDLLYKLPGLVFQLFFFSKEMSCIWFFSLESHAGSDVWPFSEKRGHTSTQRGYGAHENKWRTNLWSLSHLGNSGIYYRGSSYLLSSPPALTTKPSPLVKRTFVRWAEWPRKRLCLA